MAPNSGAPSSTRTGMPWRASASAVVSPPSPPPTMRMGLLQPSLASPSFRDGAERQAGSVITKLAVLKSPAHS